jgi:hypothetical protein
MFLSLHMDLLFCVCVEPRTRTEDLPDIAVKILAFPLLYSRSEVTRRRYPRSRPVVLSGRIRRRPLPATQNTESLIDTVELLSFTFMKPSPPAYVYGDDGFRRLIYPCVRHPADSVASPSCVERAFRTGNRINITLQVINSPSNLIICHRYLPLHRTGIRDQMRLPGNRGEHQDPYRGILDEIDSSAAPM